MTIDIQIHFCNQEIILAVIQFCKLQDIKIIDDVDAYIIKFKDMKLLNYFKLVFSDDIDQVQLDYWRMGKQQLKVKLYD